MDIYIRDSFRDRDHSPPAAVSHKDVRVGDHAVYTLVRPYLKQARDDHSVSDRKNELLISADRADCANNKKDQHSCDFLQFPAIFDHRHVIASFLQ